VSLVDFGSNSLFDFGFNSLAGSLNRLLHRGDVGDEGELDLSEGGKQLHYVSLVDAISISNQMAKHQIAGCVLRRGRLDTVPPCADARAIDRSSTGARGFYSGGAEII
jgi:hypothetical protein